MTAIFDQQIFDTAIFDIGSLPLEPPYDWAPPIVLASSAVIGQALRFLRLAPISRHDPGSELLPALAEAYSQSIEDLLARADWSFSSTLAVLAPVNLAGPNPDLPGSAMLPGDLVMLRQIWPNKTRWQIDGSVLHHTAPGLVTIRYTARVTRETALSATFQTVLALHIALRLAGRWSGPGADLQLLEIQAEDGLKQAMRDDSRQASGAPWGDQTSGLVHDTRGDWALEITA